MGTDRLDYESVTLQVCKIGKDKGIVFQFLKKTDLLDLFIQASSNSQASKIFYALSALSDSVLLQKSVFCLERQKIDALFPKMAKDPQSFQNEHYTWNNSNNVLFSSIYFGEFFILHEIKKFIDWKHDNDWYLSSKIDC